MGVGSHSIRPPHPRCRNVRGDPGRAAIHDHVKLDANPETFFSRLFYTNSAALPGSEVPAMRLAANGRLTDGLAVPPAALTEDHAADVAIYLSEYARTGFRAAINTYRSLHRNWELLAGWADVPVNVPALYIGGSRDLVLHFPGMRDLVNAMPDLLPQSEPPVILEGVGHFIQMERPNEVARLICGFLEKRYRTGENTA